ncbi:MAG: DNA mismatch repair protein MutS [Thermoplasmata archaeon]|nr:DNA mismatch repair protein MutS [Thermoplasmata archaeon]
MEQYFSIKERHRDCLLLFRLGDFYEMFGDDAVTGSKVLGITLTSRDKGKKERIPLCGVPWHALDSYLPKLLRKGYKVAICEQLEDPKHAKGIVDRDVVRIVTPGTVMESSALDSRSNNYLMAIAGSESAYGLSFVDVSTGEFVTTEVSGEDAETKVLAEVAQRAPKEILHPEGYGSEHLLEEFRLAGATLTPVDEVAFIRESAESMLRRHFRLQTLDGLAVAGRPLAISSAGAVLRYLESTQKRDLGFLSPPRFVSTSDKLVLDQTTIRNLELVRNVRDMTDENTLVSVLDRTLTPMGSRLLKGWLMEPLTDVEAIDRRLDAVQELVSSTAVRTGLGSSLEQVRDLERLISKTMHGSANARDLVAIRSCLEAVPSIRSELSRSSSAMLRDVSFRLEDLSEVSSLIAKAIADDPPAVLKEGGLIKPGFDPALDELRGTARDAKDWIAALEEGERARTGIKNLKVGFNSVFGYYIEVTKPNLRLVPATYERKQTVAGGERFVTPELKEKERVVLTAQERSHSLEYDAFIRVRDEVARKGKEVRAVAHAIAEADALRSFAEAAVVHRYSRPEVDESDSLFVKDGRHPVVERVLHGAFVPNDTHLDTNLNRLIILTGPNMAGKSTYLRQIACMVIMAQAGSFVPASEARIGVVDRVFTRVGAFDDLARGQSTFMVEMTELANILNSATRRSLILLDEVGRGTSTFDGLAIAWAVSEYLYDHSNVGAKTMFATHYHHLTELAETLEGVKNYSMSVKEEGREVVFLRKVVPGRASKSYGIHVAKLAGVPSKVLDRAEQVLGQIEEENMLEVKAGKRVHQQTMLVQKEEAAASQLEAELRKMDLGKLTPMEAYLKLSELKKRLR